jgi:hypothetical protein
MCGLLTCYCWHSCLAIYAVALEHSVGMALSSICDDLITPLTFFQDTVDAITDEDNLEYSENGRWPFQQFVDQLIHDMFDPSKFIICLVSEICPILISLTIFLLSVVL